MIFDERSIVRLRELVKARLSEKRYVHTLGVEKFAEYLGKILLPDRTEELRVAALLHDITKELSSEEHINLILDSDFNITEEDIATIPALHSFSAVNVIKKDFLDYMTENILSAVKNHTLGAGDMSVFDEIIFVSDYAEEGRNYKSCIEVREFIENNISSKSDRCVNIQNLHIATLTAINATIYSLEEKKQNINSRTIDAKKDIEKKLANLGFNFEQS